MTDAYYTQGLERLFIVFAVLGIFLIIVEIEIFNKKNVVRFAILASALVAGYIFFSVLIPNLYSFISSLEPNTLKIITDYLGHH